MTEQELYHYGVRGMKWGIRRYQNTDGSLTAAGKKKARYEYRQDNKTAYELGRNATIYGHATAKSLKRTIRYKNRLDKQQAKDPEGNNFGTKFWDKRYRASAATTAQLVSMYAVYGVKAKEHCRSLVDKYGSEAVSSIKYKEIKLPKHNSPRTSVEVINERTNQLSDYAKAGAFSLATTGALQLMGAPVAVFKRVTTTGEKAFWLESDMYGANYNKQNRRK